MYILNCEKGSLIIKYPNGSSQMYQCRFLTCCAHGNRVNISLNARILATGDYDDYMLNGQEYPSADKLVEALKDAFCDANGTSVNVESIDLAVQQQLVEAIAEGIGGDLTVSNISETALEDIAATVLAKLADRDVYCTEEQYSAWEEEGTLDPAKRYFICG